MQVTIERLERQQEEAINIGDWNEYDRLAKIIRDMLDKNAGK